jgi:hypothetical protein
MSPASCSDMTFEAELKKLILVSEDSESELIQRKERIGQAVKSHEYRILHPNGSASHGTIHVVIRILSPGRIFSVLHSLEKDANQREKLSSVFAGLTFDKNSLLLPISSSNALSIAVCACTSCNTRSTCSLVNCGGGSVNVTVPSADIWALMSLDSI